MLPQMTANVQVGRNALKRSLRTVFILWPERTPYPLTALRLAITIQSQLKTKK